MNKIVLQMIKKKNNYAENVFIHLLHNHLFLLLVLFHFFFNLLIFIMKEKIEEAGLIQCLPPHCSSLVSMSVEDMYLKVMSPLEGSHFYLQQAEACSIFECFPRAQAFKLLSHRRINVKCPFAFISLFFQLIISALNANNFKLEANTKSNPISWSDQYIDTRRQCWVELAPMILL